MPSCLDQEKPSGVPTLQRNGQVRHGYGAAAFRLDAGLDSEIEALERGLSLGWAPGRLACGTPFPGVAIMARRRIRPEQSRHIIILCDYRPAPSTTAEEVVAWLDALHAVSPRLTSLLETALGEGFLAIDLHEDGDIHDPQMLSAHEIMMRRRRAIDALLEDMPWAGMA